MTQELRRLIDVVQREAENDGYKDRPESSNTHEAKTMLMDAITELQSRLEKAEKDAERYRWLRERYTAVNFDWEESGQQAVIFTADNFPVATASCDETIDRAMEASK